MSILTVGIYFSTSQKQRESEHEMSYITIKNRLKRIIGQKSHARHVTVYVHVNVVTHSWNIVKIDYISNNCHIIEFIVSNRLLLSMNI